MAHFPLLGLLKLCGGDLASAEVRQLRTVFSNLAV